MVVGYFEILSQHLLEGLRETMKNLIPNSLSEMYVLSLLPGMQYV